MNVTDNDAINLAQRIESTVHQALEDIQNVSPDTIIYPDSGWTVKDIIGHMLAWDDESLKSLQAYVEGGAYSIPDYVDYEHFNQQNREQRKDLPPEQIYADWRRVGEEMAAIIGSFTPEQMEGEITIPAPPDARAPAHQLAHEIYEHTDLHMGHVRAALAPV